jgi:hypothetical protein
VRVSERHHLKGDKEHLFSEVLNGLDLHRPPCWALRANQISWLIAALADNRMVAIKLLDLNEECQAGEHFAEEVFLSPLRRWRSLTRPGSVCPWSQAMKL